MLAHMLVFPFLAALNETNVRQNVRFLRIPVFQNSLFNRISYFYASNSNMVSDCGMKNGLVKLSM